jgi:hypothetical protein
MNSSWGRDQWAKRPAEEWSPFSGELTMASDDKRRPNRSSDRNKLKARPKGAPDRPFDRWLQKQLHAMYDEIASEPLPHDLLDLIDKDAAESSDSKGSPAKPVIEKEK